MDKTNFTADEWKTLLRAPGMTGLMIAAASPSGPVGAVKESMAMTKLIVEAKSQHDGDPLVSAIVADLMTSEGRSAASPMEYLGKSPDELKKIGADLLTESMRIVRAKASTSAPAFSAWLQVMANNVAQAAKEGGFLGFGGVLVSDAETAALAEIKTLLA